jgi:hypothetical protein
MKNLISATFHLPVFAMGLALLAGACCEEGSDVLDVSVEGSGDVSYCGDPRVTESIDGSGSVERVSTRCE